MIFSKVNYNIPHKYDKLTINVTPYQHFDLIQTKLHLEYNLSDLNNNYPKHLLVATMSACTKIRKTDAVVREARKMLNILVKLQPLKVIEFVVHDYISFLLLSKQFTTYSQTQMVWRRLSYYKLKKAKVKAVFQLGGSMRYFELKHELELGRTESANITPSNEMMGYNEEAFMRDEMILRRKLFGQ